MSSTERVFLRHPDLTAKEAEQLLADLGLTGIWRVLGTDAEGVHVARDLPASLEEVGMQLQSFGDGWLVGKGPQLTKWICPGCGSSEIDSAESDGFDIELHSVCRNCGHDGPDEDFKVTSAAA